MKNLTLFVSILSLSCFLSACGDQSEENVNETGTDTVAVSLKEESIDFSVDTTTSRSYVVYDQSREGKRPIVLVVHEWWGLNDYPKSRAKQLAEMGYLAMAIDMFGNGKVVDNPTDAGAMISPFYQNPQRTLNIINAGLAKLKAMSQADTTQIAAIGYCFGGGVLLNSARMGLDVDGVVSFHGSLIGTPARKDMLKAKLLVCHGAADNFVPEEQVTAFKKSMDSINANYTFKTYADATHAFTNPAATEVGKKFNIPISYNAAADSASWQDMKAFFNSMFN
jgi:dienelactone hydrolase